MNKEVIQITSGRGPAECQWVAAQVLRTLKAEAESAALTVKVISHTKGDQAHTLKAAVVQLSGKGAQAFADGWLGTIQWIGQSPYRKFHKRKNWFVGVQRMSRNTEVPRFNARDVKFEFTRSRGPGGQNVNKVNTAVRAIHAPTGITAVSSESRSQHQNRQLTIEKLQAAFSNQELEIISQQAEEAWEKHEQLERGNPIRIYESIKFKRKI